MDFIKRAFVVPQFIILKTIIKTFLLAEALREVESGPTFPIVCRNAATHFLAFAQCATSLLQVVSHYSQCFC